MNEFQPPDPEEEPEDDKWERFFAEKEKNGYAVLSRSELMAKLDEAANDGYAEGRKDEREDATRLLAWAYGKLHHISFMKQEDALALDEIKLLLS